MNLPIRPKARRHAARAPLAALEVSIEYVGAEGDGVAALPSGGVLHIGRTLPGELVVAVPSGASRAVCQAVLRPSAERVAAPCVHFDACGGCSLQHWADAPYAAWKRDVVARALARAGFADPKLAELVRTQAGTRRRLDFCARRTPAGLVLGLHAAQGREVADLNSCLVLHPALQALLAPVRVLLNGMEGLRREASVLANWLPGGADVLIRSDAEASARDRVRLAAFAAAQGIGRIAWAVGQGASENAALLVAPAMRFAGVSVQPPPGVFLQATADSEVASVAAVLAGLPKLAPKARIVELYAGIGTLSFPLAAHGTVLAFEGSPEAASALRKAAGGTRVQATLRDLTRPPLQTKEFAGASVVVLDPPFAGASAQMGTLAAAGVGTVIYVSCNPAALARDAAVLRGAGYRLERVVPIDQFLWSAQVEAVCVFRK